MVHRHVGFGLSGLFIVFMTILLILPYIKSNISGFDDISIVAIPPTAPSAAPQPKPKSKPQNRSKKGGF
jgi:hypothetical protein